MAVESIKRGIESDVRPRLDQPEVLDALRRGNIQDVLNALPAGVTRQEVEEYLKSQWSLLDQGVFQNVQIKAEAGSVPPITMEDMLPMSPEHAWTEADRAAVHDALDLWKAAAVGETAPVGDFKAATGGLPADQLTSHVAAHLKEVDDFLSTLQDKIIEAQFTQQIEAKQHELRMELQRIWRLVKARVANPEFILIAAARIEESKTGILFSKNVHQMRRLSEDQTKAAESIGKLGNDPANFGELEKVRVEIGQKTTEIQQVGHLLQRLTQHLEQVFASTRQLMDETAQTRMELIRKSETRSA